MVVLYQTCLFGNLKSLTKLNERVMSVMGSCKISFDVYSDYTLHHFV